MRKSLGKTCLFCVFVSKKRADCPIPSPKSVNILFGCIIPKAIYIRTV